MTADDQDRARLEADLTARAREVLADPKFTEAQRWLLTLSVFHDYGYGGQNPTARRLAARGLCEEPTYVAPLVLVVTDLGREVARLLFEGTVES